MIQNRSTTQGRRTNKNVLQLMVAFIFMCFMMSFTTSLLAQSSPTQKSNPVIDGLRENYTQHDYELYLEKLRNREIPPAGGIVDQQAAADVLVNNNAGNSGSANFTQSETTILAFGSTVLIGFNDSGSYTGGANKFTGWSRSTDGGSTWIDGGTLPTSAGGDAGDPVIARDENTGRIYF